MKFFQKFLNIISYLLAIFLVIYMYYYNTQYGYMMDMVGEDLLVLITVICVYIVVFFVVKIALILSKRNSRDKYITYDGDLGDVSISTSAVESAALSSISGFEEIESSTCKISTKKDRKNNISMIAKVECVLKEEIINRTAEDLHSKANVLDSVDSETENVDNTNAQSSVDDYEKEGVEKELDGVKTIDKENSNNIEAVQENYLEINQDQKLDNIDADYRIIDISSMRKIGGDLSALSEDIQHSIVSAIDGLMGSHNLSVNIRFVKANQKKSKKKSVSNNKNNNIKEVKQKKSRVR